MYAEVKESPFRKNFNLIQFKMASIINVNKNGGKWVKTKNTRKPF